MLFAMSVLKDVHGMYIWAYDFVKFGTRFQDISSDGGSAMETTRACVRYTSVSPKITNGHILLSSFSTI